MLPRRPAPCAALAAALLASCTPGPRLALPGRGEPLPVRELLRARVPEAGANIHTVAIAAGESASVHLVQIRDREQPHVHTRYDLVVTLVSGEGVLHLAGSALPLRAGDSAFIPKGTPHFFVNGGAAPAAALVTFAPPFSEPDVAPARGASGPPGR